MKYLIGIILVSLALAACGGGGNNGVSQAPTSKDTNTQQTQQTKQIVLTHRLSDYYYLDDIQMPNGRTLICIEAYDYTDGGPSMSCNWEAYNKNR